MDKPNTNDVTPRIYWHSDISVEPVDRIAIPRLCEQLLLEPELTLEKAIVISSQIVTAVARAKIIAQEAIDHVQAVHSLMGLNWHKRGRRNGGKQHV